MVCLRVPLWCSGLRIQHCHHRGLGCCCGLGSIPGSGISACHGSCKKKKMFCFKDLKSLSTGNRSSSQWYKFSKILILSWKHKFLSWAIDAASNFLWSDRLISESSYKYLDLSNHALSVVLSKKGCSLGKKYLVYPVNPKPATTAFSWDSHWISSKLAFYQRRYKDMCSRIDMQ